ncbi:MAG: hypothetical protein ACQKBV_11345 [Puniceicoccales bacterium]
MIIIGVSGFIVASTLLLWSIFWLSGKAGEKKDFRLLPTLGLALIGCSWLSVFFVFGLRMIAGGNHQVGKALCMFGVLSAPCLVAVIVKIQNFKGAKQET